MGVNPLWSLVLVKLLGLYETTSAGFPAQLTASAFNRQYASSLVTAPTVTQNSFQSMAVTIAATYCCYPRRDGQVELALVAGWYPCQ